jgi:2-oxoisovalerate dehydrogenase E1 component
MPLPLYSPLSLIRHCEEVLARAHARGLVHGACHTYVGQEAVAVGVCAHLRRDDAVFSTHRGHGHALAKGLDPKELASELLGRAAGCSRGRGGSMHLFAPEIGLMGTSGIVGPSILQAAGAGYSFKLLTTDRVAVAFFGDGAVNNGAFHEGLNLAGIFKLPVIFVCENNQFATEVPFDYSAGNPRVAPRGPLYGMPGEEVDGNDVLAVHEAAGRAVARARAGQGPTLLECRTYRTRPHAEGMGDFTYRTREEVEDWKARCPIARLRSRLLAESLATPDQLDAIEADAAHRAREAVAFAEQAPWPEPADAFRHIYCETPAPPRAPAVDRPADPALRQLTWSAATLEALAEEMAADPRIFVLGEGIGKRGGNFRTTAGLFDLYGPLRLCDTPISERGFIGLACGAAMTGTRPVVDFMFADFLLDSLGEVFNQIAKIQYMTSGRLRMPLVLRGCIGIGHSAATHHSGSYTSIFAQIPGLRVVVPSNPYDAKGLFKRALRSDDPVLLLEHRELLALKGSVPAEVYEIEFGRAAVARAGTDATIVSVSRGVIRSLEAASRLAEEGVSVEVIDVRTLLPLDAQTILASLHKTGRLLVVDESTAPFGLGAEIAALAADAGFDDLDAPIRRLHGAFSPTPYSPPLEAVMVPGVDDVLSAVRGLLAE